MYINLASSLEFKLRVRTLPHTLLFSFPFLIPFPLSSPLFQVKASQDPKQKQAFILTLLKEQIGATIASPSQARMSPQNKHWSILRSPKAQGLQGKMKGISQVK